MLSFFKLSCVSSIKVEEVLALSVVDGPDRIEAPCLRTYSGVETLRSGNTVGATLLAGR